MTPKDPFWRGLSGTNSGGRFAPGRVCSLPNLFHSNVLFIFFSFYSVFPFSSVFPLLRKNRDTVGETHCVKLVVVVKIMTNLV